MEKDPRLSISYFQGGSQDKVAHILESVSYYILYL